MSQANSTFAETTPLITAEAVPAEESHPEHVYQSPANRSANPINITPEEGQLYVLRMRVKLLSELVHLSKNIKENCKTLFKDPYVEGSTPKELGILTEIRHQLHNSCYFFGEAIYEMLPYEFRQFCKVLEDYRSDPVNVNILEQYGITANQADTDSLINMIWFKISTNTITCSCANLSANIAALDHASHFHAIHARHRHYQATDLDYSQRSQALAK